MAKAVPARARRTTRRTARKPPPIDIAMVVGPTENNDGFHILRRREDHPVEVGTMRPLREGKPVDGEVVSLKPRGDVPFLFDVKVEVPDVRRGTTAGPAQVASEDYRRGWDAIWG